ncbi:MAG: M23 family metallopeptidase [Clostridia bacterium]|nr:M23 family metallopeptidase [Clostridia bacterium]
MLILDKTKLYLRRCMKLIILCIIPIIIIIGIIFSTYKPTYSVSYNGKFIGYCDSKSKLQSKINDYTQNGDKENIAFAKIDEMPQYDLCLIKRDINTNEDEIYNEVITSGKAYYKMYAILENDEEKMYLPNFEQAEKVISELKEKNSSNKESISILEKYETECKEFSSVEDCVSKLYKEVKPVKVASNKSNNTTTSKTVQKTSSKSVNLGINFITPTTGTITSRFGVRSRDNHKGIDIGAPKGTPIKASASGTVIHSGNRNDGYGNYIILSHGNGVQTYYAHCSQLLVSKGESVQQGQIIAKVGSTGISTGNHLHFEVRVNGVAQNPQNYVYK